MNDDPMRYGILILAGGEATRLPGKLSLPIAGVPLVVRVYRNLASPGREIVISAKATFAPAVDAQLPVALVVDRAPRLGPLGGIVTSLSRMRSSVVFVVAADAPHVDRAVADALARRWRSGDEAVVPTHGADAIEPLAALYSRAALARVAHAAILAGRKSVRGLLGPALRTRFVAYDARAFANVNERSDYDVLS